MKVGIIGGTGFVGGYLVDALLAARHPVFALVRSGSEAKLRAPGLCRVTHGDLADQGAIAAMLERCEAVIYNVGLLREYPAQGITFEEAHYEGVSRVIEAARNAGVRRFLLMSANGVESTSTPYQKTKYRAEGLVEASGLDITIFRPSVIFGDPRGAMEIATQLYEDLVRPPVPAPGFHTGFSASSGPVLMSPVHVEDVAAAFVSALEDPDTYGRTIRLGGPAPLSWTEMVKRVAAAAGKEKMVLPMPIGLMKFGARLLDWLPSFPVTRDQLTMLAEGNVAPPDELRKLLGAAPRAFTVENLGYLKRSS
jgi:NADH dehydrogenase